MISIFTAHLIVTAVFGALDKNAAGWFTIHRLCRKAFLPLGGPGGIPFTQTIHGTGICTYMNGGF